MENINEKFVTVEPWSATIVKFDGWANRIETIHQKPKSSIIIFYQYLPTATYVGIIANRATSILRDIIGLKLVKGWRVAGNFLFGWTCPGAPRDQGIL